VSLRSSISRWPRSDRPDRFYFCTMPLLFAHAVMELRLRSPCTAVTGIMKKRAKSMKAAHVARLRTPRSHSRHLQCKVCWNLIDSINTSAQTEPYWDHVLLTSRSWPSSGVAGHQAQKLVTNDMRTLTSKNPGILTPGFARPPPRVPVPPCSASSSCCGA